MTRIFALIIIVIAAVTVGSPLVAQTDTVFTFQGDLKENGGLANGSFNMSFALWDARAGGNQLDQTTPLGGVQVVEGKFSVELDFGASEFDNSNRWLEIVVEGVMLSPRQPITRAPYAIQTRGIFVDENKNVGIGTTAPAVTLHVEGPILSGGPNGGDIGARNPNDETAGVGLGWDNDVPRIRIGGDGFGTDSGFDIQTVGNRSLMRILDSGNIGIRTTDPLANLHIDGSGTSAVGFHIDAPGSSTGSLQIGSPAGNVGIAGFANNGHRRDIRFSDGGLGLYTRSTSSQPITGNGLFINESGNVGIGTSSPTESLDVMGVVEASRFQLEDANDVHTQISSASQHTLIGNFVGGDIILNTGTNPPFAATRLIVKNNGKVGIFTTEPEFDLHVSGSAGKPGGGSWSNSSDRRLKKNIKPLVDALGQLLGLRGVTFEYIDPEDIHELPGERIGMIAQDVEQIVHDWVETREDGYMTVTYRGFEALTVEALRELRDEKDVEIAALRAENDALRARLDSVEALVEKIAKPDSP